MSVHRVKRSADPRAERSRHLLQQALLELAAQRPLSQLSVSEVAEAATINRATFYAHYRDLDDVIVDALQYEFDSLASAATELGELAAGEHSRQEPPASLRRLFVHLDQHAALYRRVLGPDGSARFIAWLRQRATEHVLLALQMGTGVPDDVPVELRADFVTGALLGVVEAWVGADPRRDPEELAALVWRMLRALALGLSRPE